MKLKDLLNVSTISNIGLTVELSECDYKHYDILIYQQKQEIIRLYGNAEVSTINAFGGNLEITATITMQED